MVVGTKDGLKIKYHELLIGFENLSFTEEQVYDARHEFEQALDDLEACKVCDGETCRTSLNYRCSNQYWHQQRNHPCTKDCWPLQFRGYYGLWKKGSRTQERPVFAVHSCPGTVERQEQLLENKTRKWWDD